MNLVEVSALVKKTIIILAALISLYIFALLIKAPTLRTWAILFPPDDLPDLAFGLLEPLEFTETPTLTPSPEYVLNTQTGALPTSISDKALVYKYVPPRFSFGEGERAQQDALALGFDDNMRISDLNSDYFVWQDLTFGGVLAIDTQTRILSLNTPLIGKGSLYPAGELTQTTAILAASEILERINRFSDKLYTMETRGSQEVSFGKFSASGIVEADSILEAQIARVDFFRKINTFPILGPDPKVALLQLFVRAPERESTFPQLSFPHIKAAHWEVDTEQGATYPLIPISTAWNQVSKNGGVVSNVTPHGASPFEDQVPVRTDRILINDIYIAYFDDIRPQKFLQPIYVFEGNYTNVGSSSAGNITIYYPAISGDYIRVTEKEVVQEEVQSGQE